MMDFTGFTGIEMYGAVEAERAAERRSWKWLRALRELSRLERMKASVVSSDEAARGETSSRDSSISGC